MCASLSLYYNERKSMCGTMVLFLITWLDFFYFVILMKIKQTKLDMGNSTFLAASLLLCSSAVTGNYTSEDITVFINYRVCSEVHP